VTALPRFDWSSRAGAGTERHAEAEEETERFHEAVNDDLRS
jgi:hypothetical protein